MKNFFLPEKNITDFNCTVNSAKKMHTSNMKVKMKICIYLYFQRKRGILQMRAKLDENKMAKKAFPGSR